MNDTTYLINLFANYTRSSPTDTDLATAIDLARIHFERYQLSQIEYHKLVILSTCSDDAFQCDIDLRINEDEDKLMDIIAININLSPTHIKPFKLFTITDNISHHYIQ